MSTRTMLGRLITIAVSGALMAAIPAAAAERTLQQRVDALEKTVAEGKTSVADSLGVDLHALIALDYLYSFNRPASRDLPLRVFDKKHNTFSVNDAALFVSRAKEDENFGFALVVDFGDTARYTGRDWDGDGALTSSEETNHFELREAYLTYKLPWLGSALKAGTFTTLLGYEVFKSPATFNPNISNSILFGFSNPFTHTGLLLSTPLGEVGNFDVGVVNGWDNFLDQNNEKTLLTGLGLTPCGHFSTYMAFAYGAEQLPIDKGGVGAGSKRAEVTMNATLTLTDQLAFAVDSVYGNETDLITAATGQQDADWYGGAAYAMYSPLDWLKLSLRAEVFDDPDGARGFDATVWEFTPTVGFQLTDHVLARVEYRHDRASKAIFEKSDTAKRTSNTVAGEVIFAF